MLPEDEELIGTVVISAELIRGAYQEVDDAGAIIANRMYLARQHAYREWSLVANRGIAVRAERALAYRLRPPMVGPPTRPC